MKKKRAARPRLFVGSSSESLDYAYAIQSNLDDCAEVTVWKQGIFEISKTTVESLIRALDRSDFGVFVFAPNDALRLRRKKYAAVRDNVVFELGLFMGKLGRRRTFVVVPKASSQLRIPTDLMGVTLGEFDSKRKDKNLEAALGPFCHNVRRQIRKVGGRFRASARSDPGNISKPIGGLIITEAIYGVTDHHVDVTAKLNSLVRDSKLHVYASNQLGGDPYPNTSKNLVVRYEYKGQKLERTVNEGAALDLP
jgi:hypothetical protein